MSTETRRDRIITFCQGRTWRAQAIADLGHIVFDVTGETESDALATLAQAAVEAMERSGEYGDD